MITLRIFKLFVFFLSATISVSCGSSGSNAPSPLSPLPVVEADPIPRLSKGPHLGFIDGFEALSPSQRLAADQYRETAKQRGMSIGRLQIDWAELETSAGQYDRDLLREKLTHSKFMDLSLMVLISTLDSDGFTLPSDLLNSDGTDLRSGLSMDSEEIRTRFRDFLNFLLPELEAFDVWALSLGNEAESNFEDLDIEDETGIFFANAMQDGRNIDDNMAFTVTLTSDADLRYPNFVKAVSAEIDFALLNYYCLAADLTVSAPAAWDAAFDRFKTTFMGKDIIFQELGCPVGYTEAGLTDVGSPRIGGSETIQETFFATAFDRIENDSQFRGATIFQLYDWSSDLTRLLSAPLVDSDNSELRMFGERFEEWLRTVGMCNLETTNCRPAWDSFLQAASETRDIRDGM